MEMMPRKKGPSQQEMTERFEELEEQYDVKPSVNGFSVWFGKQLIEDCFPSENEGWLSVEERVHLEFEESLGLDLDDFGFIETDFGDE
jgi:hypothetical protein